MSDGTGVPVMLSMVVCKSGLTVKPGLLRGVCFISSFVFIFLPICKAKKIHASK